MKIKLSLAVAQKLLAYAAATRLEYSGFGFCERDGEDIFVYDFVLLDVGNDGYTEIDPKKILPLMEREDRTNMRVWIHKHPITGWSSRDLQTILKEPLGSTPERVGWSVSIVLTPSGWIGRIDNYLKGITKDLEIEPSVREMYQEIRELERARAPFRPGPNGPTRIGTGLLEGSVPDGAGGDPGEDEYEAWEEAEELYEDEYEDLDAQELKERWEDHRPDNNLLRVLLRELALFRSDPASTSLAEVLEDYGIDWQKIRQTER